MDPARLRAAYEQAKGELLAERTPDGHWVGELSSSALSTATAVSALAVVRGQNTGNSGQPANSPPLTFDAEFLDELITRGVRYLVTQQNPDGGFGDTDLSRSNIATTYLVVAALHLAGVADEYADVLARANAYIDHKDRLAGLRERYGIDKTFVVPIMTNCALAGLIDWREIDPLPFELACVPQSLYRFVGMPVVSYAIPALVAIGQARYFHAPPRNPLTRLVRWLSISRSLNVLRRMQPDSGGYLEATPLTSFVVMSLASIHSSPHAPREEFISRSEMPTVIRDGVKFLANSIRPDGSWPIDTNLATWNTTLAINALAGAGEDVAELLGPQCLDWLLTCQHTKRHAFTGADPGGFGWSDLSGAVPDADDTPGALLATAEIRELDSNQSRVLLYDDYDATWYAIGWLIALQNRNGGWPTFCRGWGKLPFDRSGTDLTAHVLRAIAAWKDKIIAREIENENVIIDVDFEEGSWPPRYDVSKSTLDRATRYGREFLVRQQHPDGSWSPLWFGNQDHPTEDNPVYGTAKVLMAYRDLDLMDSPEAKRGVAWLVANQNADGGWGSGLWDKGRRTKDEGRSAEHGAPGGVESGRKLGRSVLNTTSPQPQARSPLTSSVEETALAVEALLATFPPSPDPQGPSPVLMAIEKGLTWLIERVERGEHRQPSPIGFYFAKLWYYERLYPLTFTVAALGRACRQFAHPASTGTTPWTTAAP